MNSAFRVDGPCLIGQAQPDRRWKRIFPKMGAGMSGNQQWPGQGHNYGQNQGPANGQGDWQAGQQQGQQQYGQQQGQPQFGQEQYGQEQYGQQQGQPQYGQEQYSQQQGQPEYAQQQGQPQSGRPLYGQQQGQEYYSQNPHDANTSAYGYAAALPFPGGPKKKSPLPWILGGAGLLVAAVTVVVILLFLNVFGGGMQTANRPFATFQYPDGLSEKDPIDFKPKPNGSGAMIESFVVADGEIGSDSNVMVAYEFYRPEGNRPSDEEMREDVDRTFSKSLTATPTSLGSAHKRLNLGSGCSENFAHVGTPKLVQRDGLYGYRYEYTCTSSLVGEVHGQTFLSFDTRGISHLVVIESKTAAWEKNSDKLNKVIDSFKPNDASVN